MADRKKTGENQEMSKKTSHQAWEEWELTAFVLNELDDDRAARMEAAAVDDARLAAEILAIRKTVGRVSEFFQSEQAPPLSESGIRLEQIVAQAAILPRDAHQAFVAQETTKASAKLRPLAWLGLLAMSASLMLAAWLSAPAISTWMLASSNESATSPDSASPASAPAEQERLRELGKQIVTEIETETTARRSSIASARDRQSLEGLDLETGSGSAAVVLDETNSQVTSPPAPGDSPPVEFSSESLSQVATTPSPLSSAAATVSQNGAEEARSDFGTSKTEPQAQPQDLAKGRGLDGAMGMGMGGGMGGGMGMGGYGGMPGGDGLGDYDGTVYGFGGAAVESGYGGALPGMSVSAGSEGRTRSENLSVAESKGRMGLSEEAESLRKDNFFRGRSSGDQFATIYENQFTTVDQAPLSTFSIDVDTASYTKSRQLLLEAGRLPPAGAVRLEEFINYFDYEYAGPKGEDPFGADLAVTSCPWRPEHRLVRIALQATKLDVAQRPNANIVFLLDVSGSMGEPNKLPLVKESMRMLIQQLGENDKVAMVVYAGAAGCVLEGTRGNNQQKILHALENLNAGGSTNGGQGIQLAYDLARDNFVPEGVNRVILCTDGDFNVGVTNTQSLVDMVAENAKSKIFLTVLGFGMGNTNDAMMEEISNRGNGVYGFVDSRREAYRQMVRQLAGNLMTVAKDVKIQVEFNPNKIQSYRLLGYENRVLATEDFDNDKKDAGEIGAGHRVTALYEIVPTDLAAGSSPAGTELRYQKPAVVIKPTEPAVDSEFNDELLAVKMRYKQPEGDVSKLLTFPLKDGSIKFSEADRDFRWAASMAEFGMLLRQSKHAGNANWSGLIEQAISAAGVSPSSERQECLEMMRTAARLSAR